MSNAIHSNSRLRIIWKQSSQQQPRRLWDPSVLRNRARVHPSTSARPSGEKRPRSSAALRSRLALRHTRQSVDAPCRSEPHKFTRHTAVTALPPSDVKWLVQSCRPGPCFSPLSLDASPSGSWASLPPCPPPLTSSLSLAGPRPRPQAPEFRPSHPLHPRSSLRGHQWPLSPAFASSLPLPSTGPLAPVTALAVFFSDCPLPRWTEAERVRESTWPVTEASLDTLPGNSSSLLSLTGAAWARGRGTGV